MSVKLSISLPEVDLAAIDVLVRRVEGATRSSIVHEAIGLLRERELAAQFDAATALAEDDPDIDLWDRVVGDGV